MKKAFLNNEIWILTFGGGFQRSKIYQGVISETQRNDYRKLLRGHIEQLVQCFYQTEVSESDHINHIKSIVNFSNSQLGFGSSVKMNFGIAQKLLNLYLKYVWCLGEMKIAPPHFPVDRIIQGKLNEAAADHGTKKLKIEPWTQFDSEDKYLEIIDFAKELTKNPNFSQYSLPELELYLFARK
jgi:hypothetical protein